MSWFPGPSVSHGARRSEVREELEAEADHKVPDVSGHLGAGDEHPPEKDQRQGVESVTDIPQPWRERERERERERGRRRGVRGEGQSEMYRERVIVREVDIHDKYHHMIAILHNKKG